MQLAGWKGCRSQGQQERLPGQLHDTSLLDVFEYAEQHFSAVVDHIAVEQNAQAKRLSRRRNDVRDLATVRNDREAGASMIASASSKEH